MNGFPSMVLEAPSSAARGSLSRCTGPPVSQATGAITPEVGRALTAVIRHDPPSRSSARQRSEEHTSELQSLMRISYAVFYLKKTTAYLHMQSYPILYHYLNTTKQATQ